MEVNGVTVCSTALVVECGVVYTLRLGTCRKLPTFRGRFNIGRTDIGEQEGYYAVQANYRRHRELSRACILQLTLISFP